MLALAEPIDELVDAVTVDEAEEVLGEEHRALVDAGRTNGKNFPEIIVWRAATPGYGTHVPNMGRQLPYA
jgi:hypothetical protein